MLIETHRALWAKYTAEYDTARARLDLPAMMAANDRLIELATRRATEALNKKMVKSSYFPVRD